MKRRMFIAAALAGDDAAIVELREEHPGIVDAARAARPALVLQAVIAERFDVVPTLVGVGFDVDAFGRCDIPIEEPREGALHRAAEVGDVALTRMLLDLGADPNARDVRFGATPLGWARYFDQADVAAVLEPDTRPDPDD